MHPAMRLLVVDDEPLVLDTIAPFLERCGHQVIALAKVDAAAAALAGAPQEIDLVIADVRLTEGGTQLARVARAHLPGIHVILMSTQALPHDLRRALDAGVAGFLRKPVKLDELRLLVEQVATLRAERARLDQLAVRLADERGLRECATRERMVARRLHQRIFPSDFTWLHATEVALRHLPHAGMGGDYMDVRPYGAGRALLLVADVRGQGTTAAFGGIALKAWFGALEAGLSPIEVLARADALIAEFFPGKSSATAFCALYDEPSGCLAYASAGHPQALIASHSGGVRRLAAAGAALGPGAGARELWTTALAADEVLIAYTDGLCEDLEASLLHAGRGAAARLVRRGPLHEVLTAALDLTTQTEPQRTFADDISLLALRPRQQTRADLAKALAGRLALHIADDGGTRLAIGQALRELGMRTTSCAGAAEAVEAELGEDPDLVILDLALADRPAVELFRELRAGHPHLPVLLVAGQDPELAARACADLDPAGLLPRPVDTRELAHLAAAAVASDPDRELAAFARLGNEWFDLVISSAPQADLVLARYLQALGRQPVPAAVLEEVVGCVYELASNGLALAAGSTPDLAVRVSTMFLADRALIRIADERGGFAVRRLFAAGSGVRAAVAVTTAGAPIPAVTALVASPMTSVRFSGGGGTALLVKLYAT